MSWNGISRFKLEHRKLEHRKLEHSKPEHSKPDPEIRDLTWNFK